MVLTLQLTSSVMQILLASALLILGIVEQFVMETSPMLSRFRVSLWGSLLMAVPGVLGLFSAFAERRHDHQRKRVFCMLKLIYEIILVTLMGVAVCFYIYTAFAWKSCISGTNKSGSFVNSTLTGVTCEGRWQRYHFRRSFAVYLIMIILLSLHILLSLTAAIFYCASKQQKCCFPEKERDILVTSMRYQRAPSKDVQMKEILS